MANRGTKQIEVFVPAECIHVIRNGVPVSDFTALRYLFNQLSGLCEMGSRIEGVEQTAEFLNNHKLTATAVNLLENVRTIPELLDKDYLSVTNDLGKHLSHLGEHKRAILEITQALTELDAAAPRPQGELAMPIWHINRSQLENGGCNDFCRCILRSLYHLGICSRRLEYFAVAHAQLEHVLEFERELLDGGKSLLRMTKHQLCRVYEEERNSRYGCKDVFGLVGRNVSPCKKDFAEQAILEGLILDARGDEPLDLQRLAYFHRRLGLLWFFMRNGDEALRHLGVAIDYFDQVADLRNLEETREMRERVLKFGAV
jgi:hypothetical protein